MPRMALSSSSSGAASIFLECFGVSLGTGQFRIGKSLTNDCTHDLMESLGIRPLAHIEPTALLVQIPL